MSETPLSPEFSVVEQGTPFRASAQEFSPPWLRGYVGSRYVYSAAIMWDTLAEFVRIGVIQRYPSLAQSSALAPLGRDRKIFRGLTETDDHYAERLRTFKNTWRFAGNAPTLLRQLWELLAPDTTRIRYVVNGYIDSDPDPANQYADFWTIDGSGLTFERVHPCNWDWDGGYGTNIRFWLIVYRDDLTPAKWGVPPYPWAEPTLFWGGEPGSARNWVLDTLNCVDQWKAAGSHMGPFPSLSGGLIVADPAFTTAPWGAGGPFDPSSVPGYPMPDGTFQDPANRPPGAVYLSGL